jgi:rod shape determining protein RodA
MRQEKGLIQNIDWLVVMVYLLLVIAGWMNIYAAVFDEENVTGIFDLSQNSGKQFLWIITSIIIIVAIFTIDFRFYESFAYVIYGVIIFLLLLVLVAGKEVAGSRSWFELGSFRIQPSEFAKFATALAVSAYMSRPGFKISKIGRFLPAAFIVLLPAALIILQGDTGTALIYSAFILVFYREGFSQVVILIGLLAVALFIMTLLVDKLTLIVGIAILALAIIIVGKKTLKRITIIAAAAILMGGVVFSVDYFVTEVLKPHQQNRIKALINPDADPSGYGWNVTQSKIAIGSGGFWGKGYLEGTQTKFDFVPEQSTDFIFCTLGEERGWIGSFFLIAMFVFLLIRIVMIAERQKSRFARNYGYCVAGIIFFHFMVNIGMTIGLFPVIGIPLPFFSYGGSSLWAFTILLFILLKLDAHRMQLLVRF